MFILELANKLDGQQTRTVDYSPVLENWVTKMEVNSDKLELGQNANTYSAHVFTGGGFDLDSIQMLAVNSPNKSMVQAIVEAYAAHSQDDHELNIMDIATEFSDDVDYREHILPAKNVATMQVDGMRIEVSCHRDHDTFGLTIYNTETSDYELLAYSIKNPNVIHAALTSIIGRVESKLVA